MTDTVRRIGYFYVKVPDEPGTAARTLGPLKQSGVKLAEAKINITATMATAAGGGRYGMVLWVAPAEYNAAAKVLGV